MDASLRCITLWTIGHSTRSRDEFLGLLAGAEIQVLADVRRHPGSRRFPHFNQEELRGALAERGIEYLHLPELGGRRKQPSAQADQTQEASVWRNASFRAYAEYMGTEEFRAGIARLLEVARAGKTCMMCAEAMWWRCHRALVADDLKAAGHTVLHIMSATKTAEHPYTSAARIVNGALSYAA